MLEFRAKTDSVLANFIEKAPKNARYSSKTIQNELIDVCGDYIREHTCLTSNRGKFFSINADEVTDSSNNHTVLGVCHRILDYNNVHHPVIKEVFYDFVQLERTNSETVCEKLIECHTSRSIDLTKVRAQTTLQVPCHQLWEVYMADLKLYTRKQYICLAMHIF